MPLSNWLVEWSGRIETDFTSAVDRASRIELRCAPKKYEDGNGAFQKVRFVVSREIPHVIHRPTAISLNVFRVNSG